MPLFRIVLAACLVLGGGLVFVGLVNRRFLLVRDHRFKVPVLLCSLILLVGGAAILARLLPLVWQGTVVAGLFAGLGAFEWRRTVLRRRYAGSPPLDTVFHDVPLHRPFTTTDLVCHRYQIVLPEWKGKPLRIVHLTDFHANTQLGETYYHEAITRAAGLAPDLAVYTGDFVTRDEAIPIVERFIRPIGRFGDYAVLGNHDHWTDPNRIARLLTEKGIRALRGETVLVEAKGHPIEIWGCDYSGYRSWTLPDPIIGPRLKIALCHTPDAIYALAARGASVVFCGHNHAGQARLPGLGALVVPSRFGRLFDHGHFVVEGTHLFVSSGVGAATPPLRLYCQPDLFCVDIYGEA